LVTKKQQPTNKLDFKQTTMGMNYLENELYELMQQDKTLFEFLQQGSLDGVWYWDLENPENEWMSPRFWTLLGYDPSEKKHLSSEWQDLIHPEDLRLALDNFTKHCEDSCHPYDQTVRYQHKNGSTVWVRCRGVAIRDNSGKPIRMLGAHTDLTPQKNAEAALEKKSLELEKANKKLQKALDEIKTLKGILPICSHCRKIRDDEGYWNQIEAYFQKHSEVEFSHSICQECAKKYYSDMILYDEDEV